MSDKKLIFNAIRTPDGTVIRSKTTHDYVSHVDKNGKTYFVDGGLQYSRRSAHGDEVCLCQYTDAPHDVKRRALEWGTNGKTGNDPLKYVAIADMSTEHIQAVLLMCGLMGKGEPLEGMVPASGFREISELHLQCMTEELERRMKGEYVSRSD